MKPFILAALIFSTSVAFAATPTKPNIVFILVDDMGWGDFHCYGHPYSITPNIDQLAAEGTRFTQCYATGVTCCPSRTGFMTSKHPATYAKYPSGGGFGNRVTITELLKKQGYATGHFGKWHIGPDTTPGTYGIDAIACDKEEGRAQRRAAKEAADGRDAPIFSAAIHFIEEHRSEPFYVNVWGHVPHHPVDPPQEVIDAFGPLQVDESKFPPEMQGKFIHCKREGGDVSQHMRAYLAELKMVDEAVGRLVKRLDELGLRDNTIIAVSSDQGPAGANETGEGASKQRATTQGADAERVRRNAMGYAGPFRGGKHLQYEGGIRIPFIVRWPGHVPAGQVDEKSVISGIDWLPTLCSLTEIKIADADFDGEDASAAWIGKAPHVHSKPLFWKTSNPKREAAIRDGQWKLHSPSRNRGELELYDLVADSGEHHNLATQRPDIVKALVAKLDAWQATLPTSYDKSDDGDK